jgi:hypothetical protein
MHAILDTVDDGEADALTHGFFSPDKAGVRAQPRTTHS